MIDNRPLILVSNDDGFLAKGLDELLRMLAPYGRVVAVCPDGPRSGQSAAITVNNALRISRVGERYGAQVYRVNGTPCDCIKLAMHTLVDRTPDIVVSGINHGSNAGINVTYSGTMGAVFEGCAFGVPSVGFSLTDHASDADFSVCEPFVDKVMTYLLKNGLPQGVCLNVNVPNSVPAPTELRVVREARGKWSDEYREYVDPAGHKFYWLAGCLTNEEPENEDTDLWCLEHGIASVVACRLNRTADFELKL